ncbi:MAG: hypothetical protein LH616_05075 [Ilumatobacteraceae bacterium]|nr:hypothetical protein [Ilumatobacteraceae bacterium]
MAMPPPSNPFNPNPQFNPAASISPGTQFGTQFGAQQPTQGKRRWGIVIIGIVVATIGLITLVVGALAGFVEQTRSALDPEAEGRAPGSLTFDAKAETYIVSVQSERFGPSARSVANVDCTVTLANGSTVELDGGTQAIAEESGNIATVGSFDAVKGQTMIACNAPDDIRFFVDDESDVKRLGMIGVFVGVALLAIGAALILFGVFVRKKPVSA